MAQMKEIKGFAETVDEIVSAIQCDSGIPPSDSREHVKGALRKDLKAGRELPTMEEIDLLVTGGEEGEPPEELQEKYPSLNQVLVRLYS